MGFFFFFFFFFSTKFVCFSLVGTFRFLVAESTTSQQRVRYISGSDRLGDFTYCRCGIDQIHYLGQIKYIDVGPTSNSTDPVMKGVRQDIAT